MEGWLGRGELGLALERARRVLLSAWSDLGYGFYEWGLLKAWRGGLVGLEAFLYSRGFEARVGGLSYRAAAAAGACDSLEWRCGVWLDSMVAPLLEWDSLLILEGVYEVTRGDVLRGIECVLSMLSRLGECRGEPREPAAEAAVGLEALSRLGEGEVSVAEAGSVVVVAWDGFRGLRYRERVERVWGLLPPGPPPLLLEPEEAYALLSRPWRRGHARVVLDGHGFAAALGGGD